MAGDTGREDKKGDLESYCWPLLMGSSCSLKKWWHVPLSAFSSPILWSPLSAYPSVSPAFMLKRGHTHWHRHTQRRFGFFPPLSGHCYSTYSRAALHAHTKHKTTLQRALIKASVLFKLPLCCPNTPHSHLVSGDRGHRRKKMIQVFLKKIIKELQKLTENPRIQSNM